jgi:hypothetical protein
MSDAWYYAEGDKAVGPVTLADLKKLLSLVSNAKDVLVWKPGFANWEKAETVPDLALVPKPPPIPRSARSRLPEGGFWVDLLGGVALFFFTTIFMPETRKALDEMAAWQYWLLFGFKLRNCDARS